MREPETLKELIDYLEWSYERVEDDFDIICLFTDGDHFHELLLNLKKDYKKLKNIEKENKKR